MGRPGNEVRRYPNFVNLFTHPHIALGAASEEEEHTSEEECEAHLCTISSSKLKTVEWYSVRDVSGFHLNCLGHKNHKIVTAWYIVLSLRQLSQGLRQFVSRG